MPWGALVEKVVSNPCLIFLKGYFSMSIYASIHGHLKAALYLTYGKGHL